MKGKKAQLSIVIIIAVVLVLGIVIYFSIREKTDIKKISPELISVYDYYQGCIEEEVKAAIDLAGSQGGYLEIPLYVQGSDYAPFSSHLNFLGFSVPYWYYISGNGIIKEQVPEKEDIERQMENFVETRLKECDFEDFSRRGFIIKLGNPEAEIKINDKKISVSVKAELNSAKGESTASKSNHELNIDSDFGKRYNKAKEIYENEKQTSFLEGYAEDSLRSYSPVDGVEVSCSPIVWKTREVAEELKKGLEANIGKIKLEGNYYSLKDPKNKYFVTNQKTDMPINFLYDKRWPSKVEISGANNELLVAEPIGNQPGLGALGFCYAPYHFVYDLSFPVMVQILGNQGEIFQFPLVVIIDNNVPRQAKFSDLVEDEEDFDVCAFNNQDIEVKVFNVKLEKLDANISYQCFEQSCRLGVAQNGIFIGKAPSCLNGYLKAETKGYSPKQILFSSNEGKLAELILDKTYEVELEIQVDDKPTTGNAIVSFIGEISASTVVPENKIVELSEGSYNVTVHVYGNSTIVLPASSKRECIQIAKQGLAGLFGGTQEKCFDINIPESKIDHALTAGGAAEVYLLPSDLEKGKLKIKVPGFQKPDSLEKLQYNYALFDLSKLEVSG